MGRGRPRGSVKPDRRLRRDYRFSPRTLLIIEQGRQITGETETAFVEAAIQHYLDFLTASALERQPLRFPGVTTVQVAAQAAQVERPAPSGQVRQHLEPVPLVETPSARTSSSRKPTYQIYVKHAHGPCPALSEGFAYIDLDRSIEPRQCPIHRVFAQPCTIAPARRQVERLKEVPGIINIWPDKNGETLSRDCWRKENGRWLRDY